MNMPKKMQLWVIVASLLFLFFFVNYERIMMWSGKDIISVSVKSEEVLSELVEGKEEIAGDSDSLRFDENMIAYDEATNTILIPQNMSDDYWKGQLKLLTNSGEICFAEDDLWKNKSEAIRSGHAFALYHIKEKEYSMFRVVFTGMPIMNLCTTEQIGAEEDRTWSGKVMVYDQYRTAERIQHAECQYRVRGGSSREREKSSYKLELTDKKLSFLGLRKDEDWILNALYDDTGLIHNKLSYSVWQEIAAYNQVPNDEGISIEYIEVFRDNEYLGVYALTERIDRKTLSMDKNDILYKCRADRIPEEHNYTNEDTDDLRPIFILKYPKEPEDKDWEPLKDWVNYYCKEQFETYEEGAALLNMENAIDYNLFTLLIGGYDNIRKNVFLIAEYQQDGSYVFKKVPWDLNSTWGNPWVSFEPYSITDNSTWCTDISTLYFYDETKVADLLRARWKELRDAGVITKEKIYKMLNAEYSYLHDSGAYRRNYEKWPYMAEEWNDECVYEFVDGRIDFLDTYFEQLYTDTVSEAVYDGVDYADEFDVRYYWLKNYETLSAIYPYDRNLLLEHYVLYGKPYGLQGRKTNESR